MNEKQAIYAEFIKVLQGTSMLYRFGSDRQYNAENFVRRNALAMTELETEELHPDTVKMWRAKAEKWFLNDTKPALF